MDRAHQLPNGTRVHWVPDRLDRYLLQVVVSPPPEELVFRRLAPPLAYAAPPLSLRAVRVLVRPLSDRDPLRPQNNGRAGQSEFYTKPQISAQMCCRPNLVLPRVCQPSRPDPHRHVQHVCNGSGAPAAQWRSRPLGPGSDPLPSRHDLCLGGFVLHVLRVPTQHGPAPPDAAARQQDHHCL